MEIRDLERAIDDAVSRGYDRYDDDWESGARSAIVWVRIGDRLVRASGASWDHEAERFVIAVPEL